MNDSSADAIRDLIRRVGRVTEVYEVTEFRAYEHPQHGELTIQVLDAGAANGENRYAVNLLDSDGNVIKATNPAADLEIAMREALH